MRSVLPASANATPCACSSGRSAGGVVVGRPLARCFLPQQARWGRWTVDLDPRRPQKLVLSSPMHARGAGRAIRPPRAAPSGWLGRLASPRPVAPAACARPASTPADGWCTCIVSCRSCRSVGCAAAKKKGSLPAEFMDDGPKLTPKQLRKMKDEEERQKVSRVTAQWPAEPRCGRTRGCASTGSLQRCLQSRRPWQSLSTVFAEASGEAGSGAEAEAR